jgi:hypothetical protein
MVKVMDVPNKGSIGIVCTFFFSFEVLITSITPKKNSTSTNHLELWALLVKNVNLWKPKS